MKCNQNQVYPKQLQLTMSMVCRVPRLLVVLRSQRGCRPALGRAPLRLDQPPAAGFQVAADASHLRLLHRNSLFTF